MTAGSDNAMAGFPLLLHLYMASTLHQVYGDDIDADSYEYITGRTKIFDNIKAYKNRVLSRMEVSPWRKSQENHANSIQTHVKELKKQHPLLQDYTTDNLLHPFFTSTYNATNFLYV